MTSMNLMADDERVASSGDDRLKKIIKTMCYELVGSVRGVQFEYKKFTPDYIITMGTAMYYNVPENSNKIDELRERFWNEHNDKMYCHTNLVRDTFNGRNISHISKIMMRQTFGSSFHLAIYKYQKRVNPKSSYDINHVELVDGEKETLLDFVNKVLDDKKLYKYFDFSQVKRVQVLMTKYGAKRAVELN